MRPPPCAVESHVRGYQITPLDFFAAGAGGDFRNARLHILLLESCQRRRQAEACRTRGGPFFKPPGGEC